MEIKEHFKDFTVETAKELSEKNKDYQETDTSIDDLLYFDTVQKIIRSAKKGKRFLLIEAGLITALDYYEPTLQRLTTIGFNVAEHNKERIKIEW